MRCESCGGLKDYRAYAIRNSIKRGGAPGATVDYSEGTGTYPKCGKCTHRASGKALIRRKTRRHGRATLVEMGRRLQANMSTEQRDAAREKAYVVLRGGHRTEEQKLVERFGDAYRKYMQRTGRFIPKMRS